LPDDKGAHALPPPDQPLALKRAHRLAQGGARNAHLAGQFGFGFGGQSFARWRGGQQFGQLRLQPLERMGNGSFGAHVGPAF